MSKLVQALQAPPRTQPRKSQLDEWVDSLPDDERGAVIAAASSPEWGHIALGETLAEYGAPALSGNSVRAWRLRHGWSK